MDAPDDDMGKYNSDFCGLATKLCMLGLINCELGAVFEVHERTIEKWLAREPAFRNAVLAGRVVADAEVAVSLYRRATGYSHQAIKFFVIENQVVREEYTEHYPPDTTAMCAWLNNRRKQNWRQRQEPNEGEGAEVTITGGLPPA